MNFKTILWLILPAVFFAGVLAHGLDSNGIPYANAFEKFFIFDKIKSQNHNYTNSDDSIFDFVIYWKDILLAKNKYQTAYGAKDYLTALSNDMDKMNQAFQNEKFRLLNLRLKDYSQSIDVFSGMNNEDFMHNAKLISEKVGKDIIFLDEIFNGLDIRGKLYSNKILEKEISLLIKNKTTTQRIEAMDICDKMNSALKYICYRALIKDIAKGNKDEIILTIESIKNKMKASIINDNECHFLNHEVGFYLANEKGISGMSYCLDKYDECVFGCYHGIGEYIFYKNKGGLNSSDFLQLEYYNDSFNIFAMYHALGHSIYRFSSSVEEAKLKCDSIAKINPNRALMCYGGIGHEFALDNFLGNVSFEEAIGNCHQFNGSEEDCYYHLASAYSRLGLNKTLMQCYSAGSYGCIVGLGMFIDGVYSNGSLSKSAEVCNSLIKDNKFLNYCYKGILRSSVYFYNNMTRAFLLCLQNKDLKPQCYKNLKLLYDKLWFNSSLSFCNFIDEEYRQKCYIETIDYGIY